MRAKRNTDMPPLSPYPPGWEPLLAAIIAEPDDDLPRLVFADWMEENGDPERAELIRLQCRIALLAYDRPEMKAATAREKELIDANWERWMRAFPAWLRRDRFQHRFVRGFVAGLAVNGVLFAKDGPAVVRMTPIQDLSFKRVTEAALRSPALSSVSGLTLEPTDSARVSILAEHPDLSLLRNLFLSAGADIHYRPLRHINRGAIRKLLANPTLRGVRRFEVGNTANGDAVARGLASASWERLEDFTLYGSRLGAAAFGEFITSRSASALNELHLANNPIGDAGVRALVWSATVGPIRSLNLAGCNLTAESVALLSGWPGLRHVRWMHLEENWIDDAAANVIRNSPHAVALDLGQIRRPRT